MRQPHFEFEGLRLTPDTRGFTRIPLGFLLLGSVLALPTCPRCTLP